RPFAEVRRILRIDSPAWRHSARHEFRAVAPACAHIEHLHAGTRPAEDEQLERVAPVVGLSVGIGAIGRSDDRGIVGGPLGDGAARTETSRKCDGRSQSGCYTTNIFI